MQLDDNQGLETYRRVLLERRYLRTTMIGEDGNVISARITTETGEIKPYSYENRSTPPRMKPKAKADRSSFDTPVFWQLPLQPALQTEHVCSPEEACSLTTPRRTRNRSGKTTVNPYCGFTEYNSFEACIYREHPQHANTIDNIFVGAAAFALADGKKRSYSIDLLFKLLRDIPELSTKAIQNYTGHTANHSSKLYAVMDVIINAINAAGCLSSTYCDDGASCFSGEHDDIAHTPLLWQIDRSLYEEFLTKQAATIAIEAAKSKSWTSASHFSSEEFA